MTVQSVVGREEQSRLAIPTTFAPRPEQKQLLREDRIASSVSAFQSRESSEPEAHSDKYELVLVVASKDEVLLMCNTEE